MYKINTQMCNCKKEHSKNIWGWSRHCTYILQEWKKLSEWRPGEVVCRTPGGLSAKPGPVWSGGDRWTPEIRIPCRCQILQRKKAAHQNYAGTRRTQPHCHNDRSRSHAIRPLQRDGYKHPVIVLVPVGWRTCGSSPFYPCTPLIRSSWSL